MDSQRIVNSMKADSFFNKKITMRYAKRVAKERYRLQPEKAQKLVRKATKPSTRAVVFTERQLEIALNVLKGKP